MPFVNGIVAYLASKLRLIIQIFSMDHDYAGANNSFHAFKALTRPCLGILDFSFSETSLITRTRCILLIIPIYNQFELLYFHSIEGGVKALLKLYVNSKLVKLMLLSFIVFAFDLHLLRIKTRVFKDHLFWFYPWRMTRWQQINNINLLCDRNCIHLRLLPLIFCYFHILLNGWQDNHIFLATIFIIDVGD